MKKVLNSGKRKRGTKDSQFRQLYRNNCSKESYVCYSEDNKGHSKRGDEEAQVFSRDRGNFCVEKRTG